MFAELSLPQVIYLAAVLCHLCFLLLFVRLWWWKRYADRHFWDRRPHLTVESVRQAARSATVALPRMSIVIPARNEAAVIERTVEHMAKLEYPPDSYEILVVTDEKEALAGEQARESAVSEAVIALRHGAIPTVHNSPQGGLILALLGALALEGLAKGQQPGTPGGAAVLRQISEPLLRPLIWESATRVMNRCRPGATRTLMLRLLKARLPKAAEAELTLAWETLQALADSAAAAYLSYSGGSSAPATGSTSMAATLAERLEQLRSCVDLKERFCRVYQEIYPTTQDILDRKVAEFRTRPGAPVLKHVTVPTDFDGELGGKRLGVTVPSTKGRALNWALAYVDERTAWCSFYDAESRPDPRSLLYVAYRKVQAIADGVDAPRIFQGPVFQVRNWYQMGPVCKIASLYQCISHDWFLPVLYRRIPFVGGTNVHVERRLLTSIGGFDCSTLTEDLELGVRAYLKAGAWPEYLPYGSSEQTPPTYRGFYRQRLRWATGHLQVMNKVRSWQDCDLTERRKLLGQLWRKGQLEWIFYQSATFLPPTVMLLWWLGYIDQGMLGLPWHLALNLFGLIYLGFTVYAFFRYAAFMDKASRPTKVRGYVAAFSHLLTLPVAAFLLPVPYSSALLLCRLGRGPSGWSKTPRTRE